MCLFKRTDLYLILFFCLEFVGKAVFLHPKFLEADFILCSKMEYGFFVVFLCF